MQSTLENSNFPVFEANQVLSNRHLNQLFGYLDEQERLTRANLIGIGIACGLEVSLGGTAAAPRILVGRGCGVTSEGYLIMEPKDLNLVSYKNYVLPKDINYPPLSEMLQISEMFEAGEPNSIAFSANPAFLNDKVVLLFLELKKDGLRNCSPTNCDDKGAEVTARVRRLLVSKNEVKKVLLLLDGTLNTTNLTLDSYETSLLLELNLPDLRLPRYDVPAGPLSSSNVILAGFFTAIKKANLANHLGNALTAAYNAFFPVLKELYPTNPFVHFNDANHYGFLNSAPSNVAQVRFLQYYYDLFDDLIKAYDEFRWKGAELMCACCPPSELFPRHLVLSLAHPELDSGAAIYRHNFRAASAISGCEKHTEELLQLFRRLVEMTERFTNDPPMPVSKVNSNVDVQIRITPSKLGDVPLSQKAIPYYYKQEGATRLFQLWNTEKTLRRKPHHNLSYQHDQYGINPLPDFVDNPLLYDLEPNNFLRIEGHLGKDWQNALTNLINLRNQFRLPFDIVALRAGAFDEKMLNPDLLSKENCRFEDLELLYDTTREQWMGQLCNDLTYLYTVSPLPVKVINPTDTGGTANEQGQQSVGAKMKAKAPSGTIPGLPDLPEITLPYEFTSQYDFINTYASGYHVQSNKLGGLFEKNISIKDPTGVNDQFFELFKAVLTLAGAFPQALSAFNYNIFEARLKTLLQAAYKLENLREDPILTQDIEDVPTFFLWEEIDDRIEHLKFSFRSDVFKTISQEYLRRVKEVKQKQFFSNFIGKHPGIQHKAGVPVGGTFILVYHDDPDITRGPIDPKEITELSDAIKYSLPFSEEVLAEDKSYAARTSQLPIFTEEVEEAFTTLQADPVFALNPHFNLLVGAFSGHIFNLATHFDLLLNHDANAIIAQYINGLPDGRIIADFYLPYLCCSDCAGVQFVLGQAPLSFSFSVGCTNANNQAEVAITTNGGSQPYSYKVDNLTYQQLVGPVVLDKGQHTLILRDAQGTESAPQTFEIKSKIIYTEPVYTCSADGKMYKVASTISGGTGPYTPSQGNVTADGKYTSNDISSGDEVDIVFTDKKGCMTTLPAKHTCPLPLFFSVEPGCTEKDGMSPSFIKVAGGVPEYRIQIDGGPLNPLQSPHPLPSGEHTITIQDADDVKQSISVKIPERLNAEVLPLDFRCNPQTGNYYATITISGGTAPYKIEGKTIAGSKYLWPKEFAGGVKNTLKITDEMGCETIVSIQHICRTLPNPGVNIGKVSRNKAEVFLNPMGGKEPYSISVDKAEYRLLQQPEIMDVGTHTVSIRDMEGNLSETQTFHIEAPEPLHPTGEPAYRCEDGKYIATFGITGGAPPYGVMQEGIGSFLDVGVFESAPMPSGKDLNVVIRDSEGNLMSVPLRYECPLPCDKPCAGISRKHAYRMWIQPPGNYAMYRPTVVACMFTDDKGKLTNIPGLSVAVLPELLNKDFNGTIKALIDQINAKIEKAIGAGRLAVSYEPGSKDAFARLWIESFECEMFDIQFTYTYAQVEPGKVQEYEVQYTKNSEFNGTVFTNLHLDKKQTRIPAFDGSVRNQCLNTSPEKISKETLPALNIQPSIMENQLTLKGSAIFLDNGPSKAVDPKGKLTGNLGKVTANTRKFLTSNISEWIWEVERGTEAFYNGEEVIVTVTNLAQGTTVKLTAITPQGGFVSIEKKIPAQK